MSIKKDEFISLRLSEKQLKEITEIHASLVERLNAITRSGIVREILALGIAAIKVKFGLKNKKGGINGSTSK
jgi:hypothetical protein